MKKITSYLLGGSIGLVIFGAIFVVQIWFPWLEHDLGRHKRLIEAVWFTLALFAVCVTRLWRWRRRNSFAFWTSMCILFLLHMLGILFYTTLVQPILVWQWIILLVLETFVIVSLVDWSTQRFRHFGSHSHSELASDQVTKEKHGG